MTGLRDRIAPALMLALLVGVWLAAGVFEAMWR